MKKNIEKKHYSLSITFSFFILIMASVIIFLMFNRNVDNVNNEIDYGKIETINPLILEKSNRTENKKSVNLELVSEIKRVYNIDVIYGNGTENLSGSVGAKSIYNEQSVNEILVNLIDCLNKYPSNIFKEIMLKDYDIEICLVEYFNDDNIALATRDSNNHFKVYLSNLDENKKVVYSMHHETYHILEYYMKLEFDINKLYKDWNNYNPQGFKYQDNIALLDTKYVYGLDENNQSCFVTIYSKTSDKEDRAEVFADTMSALKKPNYYNEKTGTIKSKMNLISNAIRECFYSVEYGTSIYWTRYLDI